jgi:hypothetical protein
MSIGFCFFQLGEDTNRLLCLGLLFSEPKTIDPF